MDSKPHFIIIGAMKSATSTLQEQLVTQPGIFMTTPKEPNFFSDDDQYEKGLKWYQGLFSEAPENSLLGEASTHYTKLPTYPETLNRLHEYAPDLRLVYIMRHPLDRLVSHYIHEWSMGVIKSDINEAVKEHPELVSYGQYAMQLEPYFERYGADAILPVFFDRLLSEPQKQLERICRHIGYAGSPVWRSEQKASNISSERIRKFPLYNLVVDSQVATWLRRTFIPRGFRDRVKQQFVMQERPVLSDQMQQELKLQFDKDLARLGKWLNVDLNCDNFRELALSRELDWVSVDE